MACRAGARGTSPATGAVGLLPSPLRGDHGGGQHLYVWCGVSLPVVLLPRGLTVSVSNTLYPHTIHTTFYVHFSVRQVLRVCRRVTGDALYRAPI